MSVEPFNKLVKLAARAFYDDVTTKGDNQPKSGRSDNRGIAVVVLDALTRRQWVREEDLAKDLKLHSKQLRRTLRFFEEEKLVTRDHRKETAKGAKIYSAAVAATADGLQNGREGDEKIKLHTHSYCCLDYAQIYDVVRYRLHRMKKKLKDELDDKNTVQEYTALDAIRLVSFDDEYFHCESCNGELVAESDKLASQEKGDGDDRRKYREHLRNMLQVMEVQLKPLMEQINRVKDLAVPEFGTLQAWEARASAAARANGDSGANDAFKSSQGLGYGGTPMPFLGKTEVEISGIGEKGDNVKTEGAHIPMKVLPPWMIKQGMNLTKEQRGEPNQELKMEGTSSPKAFSDDKKQREQEEATKREQEISGTSISNDVKDTALGRQVGMKAKRDEDDADDVEWEEAPPAVNIGEAFKVEDLNVEAAASEDDEDDIDWEEG
ncbi:hypothetical protein RJ640_004151 [Escallonia rubra]|uniref:HTH TFE/IIEalpha-type domain-containing protein n=1 Tax=Escallonia rubra TaxID=112253 RepID=A0AA88U811_9ASTE|nr:hypothetical protein RJ640_004151 [Escallonia rubra]